MQLPKLETLNLCGNRISIIAKLERDHRCLHTIKLARNGLASLTDIEHLRAVKNLAVLSLEGNPFSEHAHTRAYAIFHLRKVDLLDDVAVSATEREEACARFGEETLAQLRAALHTAHADNETLREKTYQLERRLSEAGEREEQLRRDVVEVTGALADRDAELARAMHTLKTAHQSAASAQQRNSELQRQLDLARHELSDLGAQALDASAGSNPCSGGGHGPGKGGGGVARGWEGEWLVNVCSVALLFVVPSPCLNVWLARCLHVYGFLASSGLICMVSSLPVDL